MTDIHIQLYIQFIVAVNVNAFDHRIDYRILGDIICDYDDKNRYEVQKKNAVSRKTDSELMRKIMSRYTSNPGLDYEQIVKTEVIAYMRGKINGDDALKCAVALGKRHFAMHTLFTYLKEYIVKG